VNVLAVGAHLKLTRAQFALLIGIANAANAILVPLITIPAVAAFTAVVLNLLIVYFTTEEDAPSAKGAPT
jgi:hypothetical protein